MQPVSRLIGSVWHAGSQSRRETTVQCWECMTCQHRSGRAKEGDERRPLSQLNLCLHAECLPADTAVWVRRLGRLGQGHAVNQWHGEGTEEEPGINMTDIRLLGLSLTPSCPHMERPLSP